MHRLPLFPDVFKPSLFQNFMSSILQCSSIHDQKQVHIGHCNKEDFRYYKSCHIFYCHGQETRLSSGKKKPFFKNNESNIKCAIFIYFFVFNFTFGTECKVAT
jgi:hypothetical protein